MARPHSISTRVPRVKLLVETSRGYGQSLLRGIARYARLHGPWSFIQEPAFYLRTGRRKTPSPSSEPVDGIIAHIDDAVVMKQLQKEGVPLITKGIDQLPSQTQIPSIQSNDLGIGQMAASHLLALGFRHLGFCGYEGMYWSEDRGRGFKDHAAKAEIQVSHFIHDQAGHRTRGGQDSLSRIKRWLVSLPKPVGILAGNDDRGQEVIRCALECGLAVPQEVAVIGVDNDEMVCDLAEFPLSSIAVANEKTGYEAASLLHRMMQGEKVGGEVVVSEPLYAIQRLSTDTLAVEDWAVREALYFIRDQLPRSIAVEDVVKRMRISRRMAEIRFKAATGRTINDQVMVQRIRIVRELLVETSLPVEVVANRSGFSSAAYMGLKFKAATGLTSTGYREKYTV